MQTMKSTQSACVLVTGGSGLVGSALRRMCGPDLTYRFVFASSRDCDLTDYDATLRYFRTVAPHAVIHLAAAVGGLFKNMRHKVDMFETNVRINLNVLRVCHELGVSKVVSCLSTCIFPDEKTKSGPIDETPSACWKCSRGVTGNNTAAISCALFPPTFTVRTTTLI